MIRLVRAAVLCLWLPLALGQVTNSPPQPSSAAQLCTVEGVVVDAKTGLPLHKISLQLYPQAPRLPANSPDYSPQSYSALSDAAGSFLFSSVAPGEYQLEADGNEYPRQFYGQHSRYSQGKILKLTPGNGLKNVEFRLEPAVVITGKVTDEDGEPLENIQVTAFAGARNRQWPMGNGQTNDLGEYRIFGLQAGSFYLVAAPNNQTRESTNDEIYAPEFYPGTSDPSQATPIDTHPGDVVSGADFTLTPVEPASVFGQVINGGTGKPAAAGFFVNLQATAGGTSSGISAAYMVGSVVGADGRFDIKNVPPGSYILMSTEGGINNSLSGAVKLDVSAGERLTGVLLTLMPGVELSGRVSADPSPALKVQSLFVLLLPDPSSGLIQPRGDNVKSDGTFRVRDIPPGKYRVNVGGFPPQYYLKSAAMDGADVLENGLTVVAGEPPGKLALFLSLDGGAIQGTVLNNDSKPVDNSTVVLVPDSPRRDRDDLYSRTQTDLMGHFTMPGLPAGDDKLFAWEDLQGHDAKDPDFIRLFEDRGKEVEVRLREQQNVQLRVIPSSAMPAQ